jgi:SAM-dependent methyltransferase
MDSESSFVNGERYVAYASATNEKQLLKEYVETEYLLGNLPINQKCKSSKRVLDLGCGTGANLEWLLKVFKGHNVEGIDRSKAQLSKIIIPDAPIRHISFEDFRGRNYDFILASHVLQYIDTHPKQFIAKVYESLNANGEAWFVQQTKTGMYQIINSAKDYLQNSRFREWHTFEDYKEMIDNLGLSYSTHVLPTSFEGIDFKNPTPKDVLRIEFMLCLDDYDVSPIELKQVLAKLPNTPRIKHPNGIIKIRK